MLPQLRLGGREFHMGKSFMSESSSNKLHAIQNARVNQGTSDALRSKKGLLLLQFVSMARRSPVS